MTYAALAGLFLIPPVALTAVVAWTRRPRWRWWAVTAATVAALVALTIVFDTVMIAADLFRYEESLLLGWRIALVPIEDLAWPVAAGLLLPSLWRLLAPEEER